jgi:dienelactone hydrolase
MNKIMFLFSYLLWVSTFGQTVPNASALSLKDIMKGNEFIGHQPENIRWSFDGKTIYFDWNPNNEPGNITYGYLPFVKGSKPFKVDPMTVMEYDRFQAAFPVQYSSIDGALIAINKSDRKEKIILQSDSPVSNVQRTTNDNIIAFQQGNNLFKYEADKGSIRQITNLKPGEEGGGKTDSTFIMKEEAFLFEYIQDKNERKEWREINEVERFKLPQAFYTGNESIENLQLSKNGIFATFRLSDYPKERETHVENYIAADGHGYTTPARAKVGAEEPTHRLAIMNLLLDTVYFVDLSILIDIRKKPVYLNDPTPYEKDRKVIMHSLKFAKNQSKAVCDVRSYDNKDRWIILIDLTTGLFTEIDHQHDEAWIGGPGISGWNADEGTLGWLNDDQTVYFQSEKTGYSHIYLHDTARKYTWQLTEGKWEVYDIVLSKDSKSFYISANRSHPGDRNYLRVDIAAQKTDNITSKEGYHQVVLSPDEKTLAIRFSDKNTPWELYTAVNTTNTTKNRVTYSTTKEFNSYQWRKPDVVTFKGSDEKDIYARLYQPKIGSANKAAVIFVHGAGYLQNAHNYWSNYHREYMFHNLLVDNGFTVLDIDYRASEGYGRDYRTAIYRHMGGRDLQDHLDGKDYLASLGIDSTRVGIYGGSYGGFITLMAMLSTPGEFPCGAALRSVTDWAHYNHEYTSNILNYPDTDPEAYRKSSPIYFAENLQGKLLMLHGMVDDNVQFQDVVRLSQRFIELNKENWELAVFPIEAHGFKESYSWYDEYRRIYELFYTELILKSTK